MGVPFPVLGHSLFPINCRIDAIVAIKVAKPVKKKYHLLYFPKRCVINGIIKQTKIIAQAGIPNTLGHPLAVCISFITKLPAPKIPIINNTVRRIESILLILLRLIMYQPLPAVILFL